VKFNKRDTYKEKTESLTTINEEKKEKETIQVVEIKISDEFEEITELVTIIKFSMPDSSGFQFVIEKSIAERIISKGKKNAAKIEFEGIRESETVTMKLTDTVTEIEAEKVDKTIVKTSTPSFITYGIIAMVIAIIIAMFMMLKKYRII